MSPAVPPVRRIAISRSLTLFVSGLLVAVIAVYSWAAYQSVRQTVLGAASVRLGTLADQFGTGLDSSRRSSRPGLSRAADKAVYRAYFRTPNARTEAAATAALREPMPTGQTSISASELWDASKTRRVAVKFKEPGAGRTLDSSEWATDSAVVGMLQLTDTSMVYPTTVAIKDAGQTVGYLVQWRTVLQGPRAQEQYSRLLGANAGIYLGNARGDIWTDLATRIEGPPIKIESTRGVVTYSRAGVGERIAFVRPIKDLPWILLLEFSSSAVLATANEFLQHVVVLAVIILVLGIFAAWLVARGISRPIEKLTVATEEVASGGAVTTVSASRHAELGRLADSFNTMVARVNASHHELEVRVADRTRELQERNDELEAFAYSISHDLRAPLRAMQGFSQILLDDYGDRLDAEGRRYTSRIIAGATRMDQLIRDLLAYGRVSRAQIQPARINLSHVVNEALEQLSADLHERQADVRVQEPLPPVVGHGPTLSQVIANLVGNGVKFTPPGRKPEVHVRAEPAGERVRVWVEDNGIGIKPEHQDRIFGVFERLHSNDEYPGTGIGLAIVRKGIERMGGRVGVESSLGKGSRFWIELPTVAVGAVA